MSDDMNKLYTCVICYNLFDEATALKTCRHIFCWKCIHGKITEHDWHCCPICYTDFGPDPLEKLSHDDPLLLTMERNVEEEEEEETEESEEGDEDTKLEGSKDEDTKLEGSEDEDTELEGSDEETTDSDEYEDYMETDSDDEEV